MIAGTVGNDVGLVIGVVVVFGGATVGVGYFVQQPVFLVFKTGDALHRIGVQQQITGFVVIVTVGITLGIGFADQSVAVVVIEMQDGAVGAGDAFDLPFTTALKTGNPAHRVGMAE